MSKIPWNKGLTKENDERVKKYGNNISISKKGQIPWNKGLGNHTIEDCIKEFGQPPLCACGCGQRVNVNPRYYLRYKILGIPKYIKGHQDKSCCYTKESKNKMSESHTGIKYSQKTIEKIRNNSLKMWENKQDLRKEMSIKWKKDGNPLWNGGTSYAPYCPKFNKDKKEEIRDKYDRCCVLCGKHESQNVTKNGKQTKLDVHHIDYNKDQGCKDHKWMLVPLCISCHRKTNNKREIWESKICEILENLNNK